MKIWTPSLAVFLAVFLLSGCSHQDFGRPDIGARVGPAEYEAFRAERQSEVEALAKAKRMAKVIAQWKSSDDSARDYHIGVEDVVTVGILSLETPGEVSKLPRIVDKDGTVNIPWVGAVKIAGLNVRGAERKIMSVLAGRYIKDPQVTLQVSQYRSAPVIVTGAVNKPGIYYLTRDRRTILEILAEADGLSKDASDNLFIVRGSASGDSKEGDGGTRNLITIDLSQLVDQGDLRLNLWVEKNDMITVQPQARQFIYVLGYVQRPGTYEVADGKPVSALQVVAMAGGLARMARAENSCLLRETERGQKVIPIDLERIAKGKDPTLAMMPGDTLVVGSSLLARLSEFVKPSLGGGVNYSPVP